MSVCSKGPHRACKRFYARHGRKPSSGAKPAQRAYRCSLHKGYSPGSFCCYSLGCFFRFCGANLWACLAELPDQTSSQSGISGNSAKRQFAVFSSQSDSVGVSDSTWMREGEEREHMSSLSEETVVHVKQDMIH